MESREDRSEVLQHGRGDSRVLSVDETRFRGVCCHDRRFASEWRVYGVVSSGPHPTEPRPEYRIISMFDVATSDCKKILNGGFDLFIGRFV